MQKEGSLNSPALKPVKVGDKNMEFEVDLDKKKS